MHTYQICCSVDFYHLDLQFIYFNNFDWFDDKIIKWSPLLFLRCCSLLNKSLKFAFMQFSKCKLTEERCRADVTVRVGQAKASSSQQDSPRLQQDWQMFPTHISSKVNQGWAAGTQTGTLVWNGGITSNGTIWCTLPGHIGPLYPGQNIKEWTGFLTN